MPRILAKVSSVAFAKLLFDYYGIELSETEKSWFAFDGKELKGSILPNNKRGEAVALIVRHKDRAVHQIAFFNGSKESEVAAVRTMLKGSMLSQKFTMDALHFKPKTLIPINMKGGIFLASLKDNQSELFEEMKFCSKQLDADYEYESKIEKAHGREEQRWYWCYDIKEEYIDKRWKKAGFTHLVKVKRERIICNKNVHSEQIAYFLTNEKVENQKDAMELFQAVRQHWQVETANNVRDCILKEDQLRCIDTDTNQTMALCRTLAIKMLNKSDIKNRCELMDNFADNFDECLKFLKQINFL